MRERERERERRRRGVGEGWSMNSLKDAQKKCLKRRQERIRRFVSVIAEKHFPLLMCLSITLFSSGRLHSLLSLSSRSSSCSHSLLSLLPDQRSLKLDERSCSSNELVTRLLTIQVCLTTFTLPARFHQNTGNGDSNKRTNKQRGKENGSGKSKRGE